MRKVMSLVVLLACLLSLFGCGGGGGGNVSPPSDTAAPTVTAFGMPATASSLTVSVTTFTATDNVGVVGYMITSTETAPAATASGWTAAPPATFTFPAAGNQTAYAWAIDASGNVSAGKTATVAITPSQAAAVQGTAIDPQTHAPLAGATVNAYIQTDGVVPKRVALAVATATTDANGFFSMPGLLAGSTYYFEFVKDGFVLFTYFNIIPGVDIVVLETVNPIPVVWQAQTGTISGKVKNASTNAGLPNMTVTIRPGVGSTTGVTTATATTDSTGAYSFNNVAAGSYTAQVTGNIGSTPIITSYFTLYSFPGSSAVSNQDLPVTTPLSGTGAGQYRIVLNWGDNPSDLDSHLTGPTGTAERFHTYFVTRDYPYGSSTTSGYTTVAGPNTEAFLDVDNVMHGYDNGPETTTIVVPRVGTYRFYVHHYAGSSNISASGAQVKVYKGSSLLATYNPPAGATGVEDVWSVFALNVTATGETIAPMNTISKVSTYSLAKPVVNTDLTERFIFSNLPRK